MEIEAFDKYSESDIKALNITAELLRRDLDANYTIVCNDESQLNLRNWVRSIVAYYEASLAIFRSYLKQALINSQLPEGYVDVYALIPLLDESIRIKDNGAIKQTPNNFRVRDQWKYVFKKYSEHYKLESNYISDNRWQDFSSIFDIRNRITHPFISDSIEISLANKKSIIKGHEWFIESTKDLHQKVATVDNL